MKKLFAILYFMMLSLSFCIPTFAVESTYALMQKSNDAVQPRVIYRSRPVEFIPDYMTKDLYYEKIDEVYGDNRNGSNPLIIEYTYSRTDTCDSSLSGVLQGETEFTLFMKKIKAQLGITVTRSRSYTEGKSTGATYTVPIGKFEAFEVYIPGIKTCGAMRYEVYNENYPDVVVEERYEAVNDSYAVQETGICFKVVPVSAYSDELLQIVKCGEVR